MLGPTVIGVMPRDTLFYLRTYAASDGDSFFMLTSLVTNPAKTRKTDRFLATVIRDLSHLNTADSNGQCIT